MSWDIVLFSSRQKIEAIPDLDPNQLVPIDFCSVLESSFPSMIKDGTHQEIKGKDFSIDYFVDEEPVSNKLLFLHGEHGLFELIELAKQHGWQIYDSGIDGMIDLEHPEKNGFENHRSYVTHVLNKMQD